MRRKCGLINAGLVDYETGIALQEKARELLLSAEEWGGVLILLEHFPVITVGRGGKPEHFRSSAADLGVQAVEVISTSRGGSVTCHNPGQLVGYPIMNLCHWNKDVHWYVRILEELLIRTLAHYGFMAGRKSRYTGVWIDDRKIAAIGISIRRWVSAHGFSLNVNNDLRLFDAVVPCGIREFGVTRMADNGVDVRIPDVTTVIAQKFEQVFRCEFLPITL